MSVGSARSSAESGLRARRLVRNRFEARRAEATGLLHDHLASEVLHAEHLVHDLADVMDVLIRNLDEDAARIGKQFSGEKQAVPQVRQVAVDAEGPDVAVRLNLLGLAGETRIIAVFHVTPRNE